MIISASPSQKYCGEVELPLARKHNGVVSFDFPFTPLARRIYNEEEDKEMDIWININTEKLEDIGHKTFTLVVTPFKVSTEIIVCLSQVFYSLRVPIEAPIVQSLSYLHFILFNLTGIVEVCLFLCDSFAKIFYY